MCGIVGQVGPKPVDVRPGMEVIRHRGPDDEGIHRWERPGLVADLGFVRLSIIDLSATGHQPMCNEDGSIWIVFNGEIYNFRALRAELEALGHSFKSRSDTETILHGYEQWGDDVLDHLRGMFAFALWDGNRERLLCARDRLGIKPLLWSEYGGRFTFASEVQGLLELGIPRDMNHQAAAEYLRYFYVPRPMTIFTHISALRPGHKVIWQNGSAAVERWWMPPAVDPAWIQPPDFEQEITELLEDSIRSHMVSDVPIGIYLSGGLDSSTVVALASRHSPTPLRTFTIAFGKEGSVIDERLLAAEVARHFRTDHVELNVSSSVMDSLSSVVRAFAEPYGNPTSVLADVLARESSRYVKVALAGDGGDEIFLGYPRYSGAVLAERWSHAPRFLRSFAANAVAPLIHESIRGHHAFRRIREFLASGNRDPVDQYVDWVGYFTPAEVRALAPGLQTSPADPGQLDALFEQYAHLPFPDRVPSVDLRSFLPFNLLKSSDLMSMAHSLEVRVPFCDHLLVERLARIPVAKRMPGMHKKYWLRRIAAKLLPEHILRQPKRGFSPPIGPWLEGDLRPLVEDLFDERNLRRQGIFDPAVIREIREQQRTGKRDRSTHIFALLTFQEWYRQFGPA